MPCAVTQWNPSRINTTLHSYKTGISVICILLHWFLKNKPNSLLFNHQFLLPFMHKDKVIFIRLCGYPNGLSSNFFILLLYIMLVWKFSLLLKGVCLVAQIAWSSGCACCYTDLHIWWYRAVGWTFDHWGVGRSGLAWDYPANPWGWWIDSIYQFFNLKTKILYKAMQNALHKFGWMMSGVLLLSTNAVTLL